MATGRVGEGHLPPNPPPPPPPRVATILEVTPSFINSLKLSILINKLPSASQYTTPTSWYYTYYYLGVFIYLSPLKLWSIVSYNVISMCNSVNN